MSDEGKPRPASHFKRDEHHEPQPRESHLIRGSADYEDMLDRLSKGVTVSREPKHS